MSIDKQRIQAVECLRRMGWEWSGTHWVAPPASVLNLIAEADVLHGIVMDRADQLAGATEDSDEARELEAIGNALLAYEAQRWPAGKIPGGKG